AGVINVGLTTTTRAQVRSPYNMGAAGLGQLLRRLQTTASAMHIAAHPDDEDTALIARLARGDGARIAYLSLTRGEGGQNVIGTELFEALGVIRTEELLQARRLDGGDQFFTRAYDFGFTKTRAEAAEKWGEREVLGDMVRAIRLYRPLVIVTRFSGTPNDGHGQHQLAGHLAPLAFRAAGDPAQFPEQIREGLRPWQPRKLYQSEGFRRSADPKEQATLRVDTGHYDPLFGRSYFEIAMEGRSQHKSQEMGVLELRGPQSSGMRLVESHVQSANKDEQLFGNLDTSITGIARTASITDPKIISDLTVIEKAAARALADYNALHPQRIIPALSEGLDATRRVRASLAQSSSPAADAQAEAELLLKRKEQEFSEALERAAGVQVDVLADSETVAPGESLGIAVRVFTANSADASLIRMESLQLRAPDGWRVEQLAGTSQVAASDLPRRREVPQAVAYFRVTVPLSAPLTEPYWLREPRAGYLFKWPAGVPYAATPLAPTLISGEAKLRVGNTPVEVSKPVQFRFADDIRGELRREVHVVPSVAVALDPALIVAPLAHESGITRRVAVRLANNAQQAMNGSVRLQLPAGWLAQPAEASFTLGSKGERTAVEFNVEAPKNVQPGGYQISAQAAVGGQTFDRTQRTIAYPHIQTHRLYAQAATMIRVLDLEVAKVRVGYIMGSGDEVPDAIKQMNLPVTLLDENELSGGDLSRFDTIVVGVRASQVRPDFVANNNRLLDYVRRGGALVVQYQQRDYVDRNLPPFPAQMQARVTDENAPVKILQPNHPLFNFPNKIVEDDWRGWVHERSLYNFTTFDPRYTALLESHDPNEPPQLGGQVYAELGQGRYVYTSYAWFRQLPAGVPGAYRLFANLLSLSKAPRQTTQKD
nr:PIG-L family deacetylase [Pyrinomonadaceae bacterium]